MRTVCMLLVLLAASVADADQRHDQEARALYAEGKTAFESGDYQTAYADFRRAYFLSQQPALLFNMASAAKELNRPGDAADHLRAYLRTTPDTPDRVEIEQRIRALEEAQRLLERERARATEANQALANSGSAALAPGPSALVASPAASHKRKVAWAVGLSAGGVVVITALALGLTFGLRKTAELTPGSVSSVQATP